MATRGKRYNDGLKSVNRDQLYTPADAIRILKELPGAKFDEAVELAFRLGVDPRKADQMLRGTVSLPHGTGKSVRVAAFAQGDAAREAEAAGADIVGGDDLVEKVMKGDIEFEAAVATPDMMPVVGKAGRVLGPRGLMPNPKAGTVTNDIAKAVTEIKAGKLEYRTDKGANVHLVIGKKSFDLQQLSANYLAVVEEILRAKPSSAKGRYLRSATISTTMGPGIKLDTSKIKDVDETETVSA